MQIWQPRHQSGRIKSEVMETLEPEFGDELNNVVFRERKPPHFLYVDPDQEHEYRVKVTGISPKGYNSLEYVAVPRWVEKDELDDTLSEPEKDRFDLIGLELGPGERFASHNNVVWNRHVERIATSQAMVKITADTFNAMQGLMQFTAYYTATRLSLSSTQNIE